MLKLTSLAYQPNSRELPVRPKKHVTFALWEQKSTCPTHTRELDEDENDQPLVCPDRIVASDDKDDEPLVQPS